jgi:NTE family protein
MAGGEDAPMTVPLNLGLQGGGAHGAFSWGVLDALLEDGRLEFDAVSGTSAGAMNAVVLAHGWLDGGAAGARAALRAFWTALAATIPIDVTRRAVDGGVHLAPGMKLWMMLAHYVTPAQLNPFDLNPLRELLARQIDFERLRRHSRMQLHVAATNADTGALRLFGNAELSVDALLASGCLPAVFRAPRIDGETYWDGGYSANPAVFPLLQSARARDTLLVLLSPLRFAPLQPGDTASGIQARVAEIGFTATFRREMQAVVRERAEAARRWWPPRRWASPALRARFHLIEAQPAIAHLAGETRLAVNLKFFETLHALGRAAAQRWLAQNFAALGRRDSVDLQAKFG